MRKFLVKHIFWVIQFISWGLITLLFSFKFDYIQGAFWNFIFLFTFFLSGFVPTSLLRFFLHKYISFNNNFSFKDLLKICIAIIATTYIYVKGLYVFGFLGGMISKYLGMPKSQIVEPQNSGNPKYLGGFVIIFGWVICYFSIKFFIKLYKDRLKQIELKLLIKQAQLNTLKGNINPEFMFQSIDSLKKLMLVDVDKSRDILTQLAEILRYSLTKNDEQMIEIGNELEIVNNYIQIFQLKHSIVFIEDIDKETLSLLIPPMIVVSIVENALNFGIGSDHKKIQLALKIKRDSDTLYIEVSVIGTFYKSEAYNFANQKIKQRLRLLFEDKMMYSLNEFDQNTNLKIAIPIILN